MAQILASVSPYVPEKDVRLPVTKFAPSLWGDTFTSFSLDTQVQEKYGKEIEALKEEVKKMLIGENNTINDRLILIDNLERLGVAYHFKEEIEEHLRYMFNDHSQGNDDLFTTALRFRLLRKYRYRVSSRVFYKFKGDDGKFDERLSSDGKGLLSLYEAAHMRTHGEHILDEGLAFATHHLNHLAPKLDCPLGDQVRRALQYPLHWGSPKVETRHYMSFYERDNLHSEVLLKLAKLDFNYVQNVYKKELHDISKWWDNFDLKSKLPYARDRVVEGYFWCASMVPEPQGSFCREAATKLTVLTAVLDDTYDNYATVKEAEGFTQVLQRWDLNEIGPLPDYMKVVYKFTLSTYEELERKASERGRSFAAPCIREAIKELARGYNEELKWLKGMEIPTIEAFNSNQIITSAMYTTYMPALVGMESASDQVFEWLIARPKFLSAVAMLGRYRDDVASHEREAKNGAMVTPINMYMKHHGVTEQEAVQRIGELAEEAWMDINTEHLTLPSTDVPHDVSDALLNYARTIELVYKHKVDGYSDPGQLLAPEIAGLLINPLSSD